MYDKCFVIGDITTNQTSQNFIYTYFGLLSTDDFIEFYFIDENNRMFDEKVKFKNMGIYY